MPRFQFSVTRLAAVALACIISSFVAAATAKADNWPQFRGPTGQGLSDETGLPIRWGGDARDNIVWQSPLVGEGHASPIVWGDRVFVSTARWPLDTADKAQVIPEHHLLCYAAADGRLVWDTRIPPGPWKRNDFRSGPGGGYAAPTPATDGRHVFCAFGSAVLAAVDFSGQLVWRNELVPFTYDVTLGSSPVLYGDNVILLHAMANKADSRVTAYRKSDGKIAWEQPLTTTGFGHSTPLLIDPGGRPQLLVLASGMGTTPDALHSLNPKNGRRLWWCRGAGDAASPAFGAGIVYFDNGRGGPATAVDPTGEGDVSGSRIRWTVDQVPEGIGSSIIVGDLVYRLHAPGVLRCWQASDGKQLYAQRLEGISSTWASPVADGQGHIFFANAGKSFVIEAGGEFKLLATNDLGDANHASAAISGGRMFLVGVKNLYCLASKTQPAGRQPAAVNADEPIFAAGAQLKVESENGSGGEGPAWHPELGLLSSGNGDINRLDRSGRSHVYRKGAGTNGLLFDRQHRLVACEAERRRVTRIETNGSLTVLTDRYQGHRYNQPNDLSLDSQGRIYFSDPRYGSREGMEIVDHEGRTVEGVYRIDLDGKVTRVIGRELERPNGVLVSADDRFLFVADNNNDTRGGARKLWRFALKPEGEVELGSRKLLYDWGQGRGPDGIKQDRAGRLYVAAGLTSPNPPFEPAEDRLGGIYVLSSEGELLTFLPVPRDEVTNCAFGSDDLKTLYITAGGTLYSIRTATAGRVVWPGRP